MDKIMKNVKEDLLTYVTCLSSALAFTESYESLKHSPLYMQMVKKRGDKFIEELETRLDHHFTQFFNTQGDNKEKNEEVVQELIQSYHTIGSVIGKLPPQEIIMIADQLKEYYGKLKK